MWERRADRSQRKDSRQAAAARVLNHLFAQIKAEMEQQQQQQLLMVFLVAVMKMAHMATRCLRSADCRCEPTRHEQRTEAERQLD